MRWILTLMLALPVLCCVYVQLHRNDRAEAAHVSGLVLVFGVAAWVAWVTVALLWLVWSDAPAIFR